MPFPYKGFDSFPASFFGADIWGVENTSEMALVAKHQIAVRAHVRGRCRAVAVQ
jgi:hypothetical protein